MTDNLLENQTSQIILITHTQILQIRRLIFITDLKNIFFEFNDNLKKFFESFPITGGGPISSKKLRNFTISSLIIRVSISLNVPKSPNVPMSPNFSKIYILNYVVDVMNDAFS